MKMKNSILTVTLMGCILSIGCNRDDDNDAIPQPINNIIYKSDGRSLKIVDPLPLALDISADGVVDFTVFLQLTANNDGDRLYAGINPLGPNMIKSGPAIDNNFLNMGLLIAEPAGSNIDSTVAANERWTGDYGALVIQNNFFNGDVFYEGNWAHSQQIVAIQNIRKGAVYFGWVRLAFDKATKVVTIIDYAYVETADIPIKAGAIMN